jgi:putative ABC transport system permease protein
VGVSVPLARRILFQDRRRAALSAGGVAAALLLVLVLDGVFAGAMRQVTAYLRRSPADVIVSQQGVRTMHMSASALDPATADRAAGVDGVAWVAPIRFTSTAVSTPRGEQLTYVIGYDPATGRGGPNRLTDGRAPVPGEVVIDEIGADRLGVAIGDDISVLGATFRISGLSRGGTSITNTTIFMVTDDFAARRGPAVSYLLVAARPGVRAAELAERVAAGLPETTVQTRDEFVREEASIVRDMSADVMRIMAIVGFLIALGVVGLSLFTLTLARLHDYGIVKALGGADRRLAGVVLAQAFWSVGAALAVATLVALGVGAAVGALDPSVSIAVTPTGVARVGVGALAVGLAAALVPLRRVAAVDPASVFRRPT